jgi:large subunit ribosomal protein L32
MRESSVRSYLTQHYPADIISPLDYQIAGKNLRSKSMPPHPKRKHSKSRRDMRRAHDALEPRNLTACSNCGLMRLPHTVCPNCGFYEGREVVEMKKEKKKAE